MIILQMLSAKQSFFSVPTLPTVSLVGSEQLKNLFIFFIREIKKWHGKLHGETKIPVGVLYSSCCIYFFT